MAIVFGYSRDSGGPAQDRSVADQRQAIDLWAEQHGHTVARHFSDEARSGTDENRAQFQEMIVVALKEKPHAVVVWNQARFARDQDAAQYYRGALRRAGIEVISLNDRIPDGPLGRVVEGIIDYGYELQVATLRYEVKRGQRALLARGYIPGTPPPTGYRAVRTLIGTNSRTGQPRFGTRWEVDDAVAPLVRQAFEMRAAGESARAILYATRIVTSRPGLAHLLRNPAYRGVYVYGDEEYRIVPAIVDDELWRQAQYDFAVHPRTAASTYLLTGILRCGTCGGPMSGVRSVRSGKHGQTWVNRYYACVTRDSLRPCGQALVRADNLELDVLHYVMASLLEPATFARFVAEVRAVEKTDVRQVQADMLDRKIATEEQKQRDLVALVGTGIAVEEIGRRLKESESELRILRQQRTEIVTPPPLLSASEEHLRTFAQNLQTRLDAGSVAVKRAVLRMVVERITFGPELRIAFKLPG